MKDVIAQWNNDVIDSAAVLTRTDEFCLTTEGTFEEVVEAAVDDGLATEDAEQLIQ